MHNLQEPPPEIKALVGQLVVIDTDSSFVYVGTLESAGSEYFTLTQVDVHDTTDCKTSKELYVHEAKRLGMRENRKLTYLRTERVLSISKLEDIITF